MSNALGLLAGEQLDAAQKRALAEVVAGAPAPDFAHRAIERADGRARRVVVESILGGDGADPAHILARSDRPVAFVCGERDPIVSPDFMRGATGPALWRGGAVAISDAGHAPFLDEPAQFTGLLLQFMRDAASRMHDAPVRGAMSGQRLTA